jgi:hypothetical protein
MVNKMCRVMRPARRARDQPLFPIPTRVGNPRRFHAALKLAFYVQNTSGNVLSNAPQRCSPHTAAQPSGLIDAPYADNNGNIRCQTHTASRPFAKRSRDEKKTL